MSKSTTIAIQGIGPVLFERSLKARRINVAVRPFKGIRVAVPRGVSFDKAERLIDQLRPWIRKNQTKVKRLEAAQTAMDARLAGLDRAVAREHLVARLLELATAHGFTVNRIFIRQQKTRWGSCSAQNNINLNIKLLLLPAELRDFILLHELVHTEVKNHGPEFWRRLLEVEPRARLLDARMKRCDF